MSEVKRVVLWKARCSPSYEPTASGACARKAAPEKPTTPLDRIAQVQSLAKELIAFAATLEGGSARDAAVAAMSSARGKQLLAKLKALGLEVTVMGLAHAIVEVWRQT